MTRLILSAAAVLVVLLAEAGSLILVGDSTLAPRKPEVKAGSWGDAMGGSLAPGWKIVNAAVGGRTVRTIQQGGRGKSGWDKALAALEKGDFVIVQFGINDANPKKLVAVPDFKAELAKFAGLIREKGATPVFCSPVAQCSYGKDGAFVRSKGRDSYAAATREAAEELKADFVDMTRLTGELLASVGKETGLSYTVGQTVRDGKPIFDSTHPSKAGAKAYGEAFIREVRARNLPIAAIFQKAERRCP